MLHTEGLDAYVVRRLGLPFHDVDWSDWDDLLRRVHRPARTVTIALVGKYVDLPDAYLSPAEALRAGGFANDARVNIRWVPSDDCQTPEGAAEQLADVDGVLVPGGFGVRGIEGKIGAVRYAREHQIPLLGLCLGLQCMAIEVARNLAGLEGANSAEFDPDTAYPVIATMADQEDVVAGERDMGGTMRLGLYPAVLAEGSLVRELYGAEVVQERHRHRYEVNNAYRRRPGAGRAGLLRACRRTGGWWSSWSCPGTCTRSSSRPRPTRVPVPADPAAPAVQRAGRRRPRAVAGRAGAPRRPWPPQAAPGGQRPRGRALGCLTPSRAAGQADPESTGHRPGALADLAEDWPVIDVRAAGPGQLLRLRRDAVRMPDGAGGSREVIEHPGAVAIVALDDADRVLLIRQYRHPVGAELWEIPAGLRDVAGEPRAPDRRARAAGGDRLPRGGLARARRLLHLARVQHRAAAHLPGPRR